MRSWCLRFLPISDDMTPRPPILTLMPQSSMSYSMVAIKTVSRFGVASCGIIESCRCLACLNSCSMPMSDGSRLGALGPFLACSDLPFLPNLKNRGSLLIFGADVGCLPVSLSFTPGYWNRSQYEGIRSNILQDLNFAGGRQELVSVTIKWFNIDPDCYASEQNGTQPKKNIEG